MKKRFIIFLFISFTLTAIAGAQTRYAVIPESPRPGDPVTIGMDTAAKEALLFSNGRQVARAVCFAVPPADGQRGFTAALLAIPSTVSSGSAVIRLNNDRGTICEIPITIAPREFRSETITLTPALTSLVSEPDPQKTAESNRLWQILTTNGNQVYHSGTFVLPTTATRRTSQFGTRRVNEYSDGRKVTSIHAGVDFGIPTGSQVGACGAGRVILSRMRIVTGNSIIIEHAPGVYSIYYHLDSVIAQEGAIVQAGEVIGLSGSTGFSTGPHLHWELRVGTENTDPDVFVSRQILDKELIISRIYN